MKRNVWEVALLVAGLLVIVAIAFSNYSAQRGANSTYSTYDSGPYGYRALFDVLARDGVSVRRFERQLGLLDRDVHTLVISSWQRDVRILLGSPIDRNDAKRLQRFVSNGGTLVILDDAATSMLVGFGLGNGRIFARAPELQPVLRVPVTQGVSSVAGTVGVLYRFNASRVALPLLGAPNGAGALGRRFGKGRVVVITAPDIFSNRQIGRAGNARFAYQLLAGRGPVAFDERVHGYEEDKSFWAALPAPVHVAVWIVIAILVLAIIGANVRFAPPVPLEPPDERDSSAYITSMAALLARANAGRTVVARFADDATLRARRRATERDETRRALEELQALRTIERPNAIALLRAAHLYTMLRKDLA